MIYDSSNRKHLAALKILDNDSRFGNASHLVNCFKLDTLGLKGAGQEFKVSVHLADGSLLGEILGDRELRKAYDLLEAAWQRNTGRELSKILPRATDLVSAIAYFDYTRELIEVGFVCPDCGKERHDAMEKAAEMKLKREAGLMALAKLKNG